MWAGSSECRATMFNPHDFPPPARVFTTRETNAMPVASASSSTSRAGKSNAIVRKAMEVLINLEHRGACGCEANTGDGAGILIQTPDTFFRKVAPFSLPDAGLVWCGPRVPAARPARSRDHPRLDCARRSDEGATFLGWRDVPSDNSLIGDSAKATQPVFQQLFIGVPVRP